MLTRAEAEHLGTSLLGPTIDQSPHALALALARLPSDDEGNVLQEEFGAHEPLPDALSRWVASSHRRRFCQVRGGRTA